MVSPELLRRYPFFGGLSHDYLVTLAKAGEVQKVEAGHRFFQEGDKLKVFYLVLEGAVSIDLAVSDQSVQQDVSGQLTGELTTKDVTISTVGTGDVFGWSALIPPTNATAGGMAVTRCRVIAFNCDLLLPIFDEKCEFGYLMVQKAAQVIRERLRDMRIESLVHYST